MNGIAFDLILVLFFQALIVSLLLLGLFRLRAIFGLSLLFVAIGVLQFLQVFLYNSLYFEIIPAIFVSPGTILFTGSLFAILLIYIREDALEARKVIYAIIASNIVLVLMQYLISWKIEGAGVLNIYSFPKELFLQQTKVTIVGTFILFLDVFTIIFIFEILSKYISSLFLRIFLSMALVLSFDAVLFNIGVYYGTDKFLNTLVSHLISKNSAAFVYSAIFTFYLLFLDKTPVISESKSNTSNDLFSVLTYRQKFELVQSEKEIQEKEFEQVELKSQSILNAIDELVFTLDTENRFTSFYAKQEQLYTTPDKFLNQKINDIMPPHFVIPFENALIDVKNNKTVGIEYYLDLPTGKHWYSVNLSPMFINEIYTGLAAVSRDITSNKIAEEIIIEERNKAKQYLNVAGVMLVSLDTSGIVQLINPKGCEILGYSEDEIIGANWFDTFIPEPERKHVKEAAKKVFKGEIESVKQYENYILNKSGEEVLIAWKNELIIDSDGKIIGVLSSGEDISQRKQVEAALVESEQRFYRIFDEGPLGIVMASFTDGYIQNANQAFCKMLGYTKEELKLLTFTDITHQDYHKTDLNTIKSLLEGSIQTHITEKQFLKKNGEIIWAKRTLSKISSSDDKSEYALAIIEDITEHKLAEQELKKYQNQLEELVQDRTMALSNSQNALLNLVDDLNIQSSKIDIANKKLASKNEELEAFTYSVSHDLRSPLRHIDGFANLLLVSSKNKLDKKEETYFNNIIKSSLQMNQLIDGLLIYSKTGRAGLKKANYNMKSIVEKVIPTFVFDIKEHNISLIVDDMPDAFIDAFLMTQVWENLISNAIKFSGKSKNPKIHIGYEKDTDDHIIYFIKDNGAGFDQKYVDKVFGVFQRLHSVNEFPGTGIGLATTKLIIMKHDGEIWAEGVVNKGAKFFMKFPNY